MVKFIFALITTIGLLLSTSSHAYMTVSATIDKNPVVVNESFVLTVTADDDVNTNSLDTSALLTDFIVGRTSVSSQTSMVNFKTTRTTKWSTVLIARQAGSLVIPSLSIENESTQPIELTVLAANDPQASKQQDLFITTDISSKEVYVQQQLTLTVKLHFAAELKRGSLTEPSLEGANITQIGKDKEGDTIINGRRYRIIERTYAISPQQSGDFTLKSPVFSGEIMVQSARRNSFLSFGETKPVSVIGDEIPLTIHPIPTNYQGAWLPSELLTVHQEWQPDVSAFTVGEPITRTITLTAAGLSEEQLPEINMVLPKGLKVYPDQAELHTGMNNDRLVSQKVRNFAIVANKPGTFHIPEISIPWWNTITNKYQQATIAAQTITVHANPEQQEEQPIVLETEKQITSSTEQVQPIVIHQASWLQWLFLALWLITSLAWFTTYVMSKKVSNKSEFKVNKVNDYHLALLAACKKNDGEQVISLLVPWFNTFSDKSISTISQVLANSPSEELTQAIEALQKSFYAKETTEWNGNDLLKAVIAVNKGTAILKPNTSFALNP